MDNPRDIRGVYFDWGGVLAEEGFHQGMHAMAEKQGLDSEAFFSTAIDVVWDIGFVTGGCDEAAFWNALRAATGIKGADAELRREILSRFVPRPWMFDLLERLRAANVPIGILSDQTNWLDELDAEHDVFSRFDVVLNSFHEGHTKSELAFFDMAVERMGVPAGNLLFVDDNQGNVDRGRKQGLNCILYTGRRAFEDAFAKFLPRI